MIRFRKETLAHLGFPEVLTLAFAVVCAFGMSFHEMWRDELQIWVLVRDSHSLLNLFQNLRYEVGHPFLWYLSLYPLAQFTRSPIAMQMLHWAIATASVYLLARFSPFSRLQKGLFAFGYFSLFEYGIISRNYGLGVLLLFGVCVLFKQRHRRHLSIAGLLLLACNTNFYALVCAVAIALLLVLEFLIQPPKQWNLRQKGWDLGLSGLIVLAGLGLYYLQILPPADTGIVTSGVKPIGLKSLISAISLIWKSYAPIPWLSFNFWNTNLVAEGDAALLSVLLLVGAIAVFIRKPLILFLYLSGTFTIILFALLKHGGGVRHWGYAFVMLVISLWLHGEFPDSTWQPPAPLLRLHHWLMRQRCLFFTVILSLQLVAGVFAYGMDWVLPFSQAKATAQLIQQNPVPQSGLVGDHDWAAVSVSGFLDQPMYYPASDRLGTFIVWNNQRANRPLPLIAQRVNQFTANRQEKLLLVLNYELQPSEIALFNTKPVLVKQVTGAIVADENYCLYQLQTRDEKQ